jgi:hypothetical protein
LPTLAPDLQLHEDEQQLAALLLHIDALMVGFAVQALQAAAEPARQAAIHAQALVEQQQVRGMTCVLCVRCGAVLCCAASGEWPQLAWRWVVTLLLAWACLALPSCRHSPRSSAFRPASPACSSAWGCHLQQQQ